MSDILKMVDNKVDPGVIKEFIKNSSVAYSPTAQEIIALKQRGVPDEIVSAMLVHGGEVRAQLSQAVRNAPGQPTVPQQYFTPTNEYGAPTVGYEPEYPYYDASYPYYYGGWWPYSYWGWWPWYYGGYYGCYNHHCYPGHCYPYGHGYAHWNGHSFVYHSANGFVAHNGLVGHNFNAVNSGRLAAQPVMRTGFQSSAGAHAMTGPVHSGGFRGGGGGGGFRGGGGGGHGGGGHR